MKVSPEIMSALQTFYERNSANDQESYPRIVSGSEAALVIGSSASEWFEGQAAVRSAFGIEGVRVDPGEIRAWEEGSAGWAVNTPTFHLPDGKTTLRLRMTTVFVREDGAWKLVHIHCSAPVPDEIAIAHQDEWWAA